MKEYIKNSEWPKLVTPGLDTDSYELHYRHYTQRLATFVDKADQKNRVDYFFNELGFPSEMRRRTANLSEIFVKNSDISNPVTITYRFEKDPQVPQDITLKILFEDQLQLSPVDLDHMFGYAKYKTGSGLLEYVLSGNQFGPEYPIETETRIFNINQSKFNETVAKSEEQRSNKDHWEFGPSVDNFIVMYQEFESKKVKYISFPYEYRYSEAVEYAFSDLEFSDALPAWRLIPLLINASIEFAHPDTMYEHQKMPTEDIVKKVSFGQIGHKVITDDSLVGIPFTKDITK